MRGRKIGASRRQPGIRSKSSDALCRFYAGRPQSSQARAAAPATCRGGSVISLLLLRAVASLAEVLREARHSSVPTRVPHLGPCEGSWLGCPAASSIVACPPTRSLAGGSAVQRALGSLHPPQPCAGHLDAAWARTAHRVAVSACPVRGPPMPDSQGTGRVWGGLERLCCARQRRPGRAACFLRPSSGPGESRVTLARKIGHRPRVSVVV